MRILLLSYLFPPNSAVGGRRWEQLSILASARGWTTHAVTLDVADIPNPDLRRLAELPSSVHVHGVRARQSGMDRFTRWAWSYVRRARGQPPLDTRVDWRAGGIIASRSASHEKRPAARARVLQAAKRAYSAIKQTEVYRPWSDEAAVESLRLSRVHPFDVVVSSGPPHMVHRAGHRVARELRIPHVVDMRDLWSLAERLPDDYDSPVWNWLNGQFERPVMRDASLVVANTVAATKAMKLRFPGNADRMITVMNGADDTMWPAPPIHGPFIIAFAGTIYLDRDPRLFFRAVSRFVRDEAVGPEKLRLRFMGNVAQYRGVTLESVAAEEGVGAYLELDGFMPHAEVTRRLAEAHMLMSLPQDSTMAIPAKIFEYSSFSAWLLILAGKESATEMALRDTAAFVVEPWDVDGMRAAMVDAFALFKRGEHATPVAADGRFSRQAQAEFLFDAISAVVASRHP